MTPSPGDQEQVPDPPQENPEPPVEKPSEPFSSAVLNFCYYDVEGVIDHESRRVDFELEVYGTDTPNLTNQSLIFDLKEGFSVRNVEGDVVTITLSVKKPVKITFLEGENALEYEIYVNHIVKESSVTEFEFKAGVNLSYWFQTDIPWPDDITLEQIKDCGFDHVRLPVDSSCLFDEKGNIRQDIMNQVHHVIQKSLDFLNASLILVWLIVIRLSEPFLNKYYSAFFIENISVRKIFFYLPVHRTFLGKFIRLYLTGSVKQKSIYIITFRQMRKDSVYIGKSGNVGLFAHNIFKAFFQ